MMYFACHLDIFSKKKHNYLPAEQSYPLKWVSSIVRHCQQNMFHSALGQEKKNLCCPHRLTHLKKKKGGGVGNVLNFLTDWAFFCFFVFLNFFWGKGVNYAFKFGTFGCFLKKKKSNRPTQIFRNSTWGQHNNFLFLALLEMCLQFIYTWIFRKAHSLHSSPFKTPSVPWNLSVQTWWVKIWNWTKF